MSLPLRRIFPLCVNPGERSFRRLSERRKVVLPLLAGPMIASRSWGRISRLRLLTAGRPSNEAVKPWALIVAAKACILLARLDGKPSCQGVDEQIQCQDDDDEHRRRCI